MPLAFGDNVPEEEKVRRLQGMIDLQNKLSEESNLRDIGKTFEVLIEGFSKRSREQLFGRTSQNKVVIFDKKNYHVGQFIKVRSIRLPRLPCSGNLWRNKKKKTPIRSISSDIGVSLIIFYLWNISGYLLMK